ncbi:MAG: ferritin-like protein [Pirellulales bacterium]
MTIRRYRFSFAPSPTLRPLSAAALAGQPAPMESLRPIEPKLTPRDEVVFLLHTAAEIEHSLLVQYLYAAYSLGGEHIPPEHRPTVDRWTQQISTIAIQEMAHLVSMQNVLWLLGGPLNLDREDFPFRGQFYPFHFKLEPLSLDSLAKYVVAEMPEIPQPSPELQEIIDRANEANAESVINRVGALFARILEVFDHLQPSDIRPDTAGTYQATPLEWGGTADRLIRVVSTLDEAKQLLRDIAVQGEGGSSSTTSHFGTFRNIYRELNNIAGLVPSRAVPTNPNTARDPFPDDPEMEAGRITHAEARRWAHLGELRYRMLLAYLLHSLLVPRAAPNQGPRANLVPWTFWAMRGRQRLGGLKSISLHLATLPQHDPAQTLPDGRTKVAGLPFDLPYSLALPLLEPDRWRLHIDLLDASATLLGQMQTNPALVQRLREIDVAVRSAIEQGAPPVPPPPVSSEETPTQRMVELIRAKRDESGAADFHGNVQYPGDAHALADLFDESLAGNKDLALLLNTLKSRKSLRDPQGRRLVVPGSPDESVFYRIVTNADGLVPFMADKFSDEDRQIVRGWIAAMTPQTPLVRGINRLSQIQIFLDEAVEGNEIGAHGAFWRGLSRDEFVAYRVFNTVRLVQPGDGANSNLVKALHGDGFPRMPLGYPPMPEDRIEFIERWIQDGCPAELSPSVAIDFTAGGALAHERHNAFWREFDNWSMFHARPEMFEAVGVLLTLAGRWDAFARATIAEAVWVAEVNQPASRAAIVRVATRLMGTVEAHYGNPTPGLTLLESFELFGKGGRGGLAPDPLRPADRQHQMNGPQMWFNWCALLDGCVRQNPPLEPAFWRGMMRAVLLGLMNDGVFRERFPVVGFSTDDPSVGAALRQHVLSIPEDFLDEELARRFRDTGFVLPFGG